MVLDTDRYYSPNEKVVEAIKTIINELNAMGSDHEKRVVAGILDTVKREHRMQQKFWSAMLMAQIQYADAPFDLRNEDAVELAKVVKEAAVKHNMDYGLRHI